MSGVERSNAEFEIEVPVIVVGAGAAGLTAALAAREAGAEVLLLERDAVPRGSTTMSQGYVCAAASKVQRESGVEDDADAFYRDIMARTKNTADPGVARTVADHSGPAIDWLVDRHRIPFRMNLPWQGFFGHSVNRMHGMPSRRGEELHGALTRAVDEIGVDTITGAHVETLYADDDGRVTGLSFRREDGSVERVGCKALVLATCGFGANREMVRRFIPSFGTAPYYRYFGHEGNEGEGIEWGMALGGAVGSMDAFQGYGALADPYGVIVNYDMVMRGAVTVNIRGERFSNENLDISAQALNILEQPDGTGWIVFDEARRAIVEDLPEFRDLLALGGVRSAGTAAELAEIIRVPAEALARTLADVVEMAAGRAACPFGRDFTGHAPLTGRLYAIRTTGALFHTQGGLKIDANAQVVRADATPLPNLFAAGGAAQGISGNGVDGYLPAAGLCTAITLGMLAGRAAARIR
ncbi:FAD-dependent oxidoreductase [Ensifer soli]|uniref:FAD-dependent oxidoreductase n=1 Tax=Ciceribacter sp. sgz301302 TaxID=3342379 RepID=UPI0035BAA845